MRGNFGESYTTNRPVLEEIGSKIGPTLILSVAALFAVSYTHLTGCESVATVMALQYAGKNISVDTFIDQYLPIEPLNPLLPVSFDPYITFGGNPRTMDGYGLSLIHILK